MARSKSGSSRRRTQIRHREKRRKKRSKLARKLGVSIDEAAAAGRPFDEGGLQPRLNAKDGSVRDF